MNDSGLPLWQEGYDDVEVRNVKFLRQKLGYLHNNPVKAGFVENPWDYRYSSAVDYSGKKGLVPICFIDYGLLC